MEPAIVVVCGDRRTVEEYMLATSRQGCSFAIVHIDVLETDLYCFHLACTPVHTQPPDGRESGPSVHYFTPADVVYHTHTHHDSATDQTRLDQRGEVTRKGSVDYALQSTQIGKAKVADPTIKCLLIHIFAL